MIANRSVFISYRRESSSYIARAIFLELRYSDFDVFMDVESINAGQFESVILTQIEARAHFIVILSPGSLERCVEPDDWLRREIEHAIEKKRNIVPVFVNNFSFSDNQKYLTGKLDELRKFNGLNLYHDYFTDGIEKLKIRFLSQTLNGDIKLEIKNNDVVQQKIEYIANQPKPTKEELDAEEAFSEAYVKQQKGALHEAIAHYTRAILKNPKYTKAYYNRGLAYFDLQEMDQAIQDYTQAIICDTNYAKAYNNRGLAYFQIGQIDLAIQDYTQAIDLNPHNPTPYKNRGLASKSKGELDDTISDYRRAILYNPENSDLYNNLGNAFFVREDWSEAIKAYQTALFFSAEKQNSTIHFNIGLAYYAQQDYTEALKQFTSAIEGNVNNAELYIHRARTYDMLGKYSEAVTDLQRYLDLIPEQDRTRIDLVNEQIDALLKKTINNSISSDTHDEDSLDIVPIDHPGEPSPATVAARPPNFIAELKKQLEKSPNSSDSVFIESLLSESKIKDKDSELIEDKLHLKVLPPKVTTENTYSRLSLIVNRIFIGVSILAVTISILVDNSNIELPISSNVIILSLLLILLAMTFGREISKNS